MQVVRKNNIKFFVVLNTSFGSTPPYNYYLFLKRKLRKRKERNI